MRVIVRRLFNDTIKEVLRYFPYSADLEKIGQVGKFEKWRSRNSPGTGRQYGSRRKLWEAILTPRVEPALFLEFGVFQGASIKNFAEILSNPDSRLFGFDTFTGLPETWLQGSMEAGHFDVRGELPVINDARVEFVKGLFQATLPDFVRSHQSAFQQATTLVLHLDADLYSSTLYVLSFLNDHIKAGTIAFFDEFSSLLHEFRALDDYCAAYQRKYEVLGVMDSRADQIAILFH